MLYHPSAECLQFVYAVAEAHGHLRILPHVVMLSDCHLTRGASSVCVLESPEDLIQVQLYIHDGDPAPLFSHMASLRTDEFLAAQEHQPPAPLAEYATAAASRRSALCATTRRAPRGWLLVSAGCTILAGEEHSRGVVNIVEQWSTSGDFMFSDQPRVAKCCLEDGALALTLIRPARLTAAAPTLTTERFQPITAARGQSWAEQVQDKLQPLKFQQPHKIALPAPPLDYTQREALRLAQRVFGAAGEATPFLFRRLVEIRRGSSGKAVATTWPTSVRLLYRNQAAVLFQEQLSSSAHHDLFAEGRTHVLSHFNTHSFELPVVATHVQCHQGLVAYVGREYGGASPAGVQRVLRMQSREEALLRPFDYLTNTMSFQLADRRKLHRNLHERVDETTPPPLFAEFRNRDAAEDAELDACDAERTGDGAELGSAGPVSPDLPAPLCCIPRVFKAQVKVCPLYLGGVPCEGKMVPLRPKDVWVVAEEVILAAHCVWAQCRRCRTVQMPNDLQDTSGFQLWHRVAVQTRVKVCPSRRCDPFGNVLKPSTTQLLAG